MKALLLSIVTLISALFISPLASATTLKVTYRGAVILVQDGSGTFGGAYKVGDPISGSFNFGPIPGKPAFDHEEPGWVEKVFETPGAWQSGPYSATGNGFVGFGAFDHAASAEFSVNNYPQGGNSPYSESRLYFLSGDALTPQLLSFTSFPKDMSAMAALWGGTFEQAIGSTSLYPGIPGPGSTIVFRIEDALFTVTPTPAALPLLASAPGAIAFLGWQARKGDPGPTAAL